MLMTRMDEYAVLQVGYTVRFEDKTSHQTHIKYLTDGMLIQECLSDPLLSKYKALHLDNETAFSPNLIGDFGRRGPRAVSSDGHGVGIAQEDPGCTAMDGLPMTPLLCQG